MDNEVSKDKPTFSTHTWYHLRYLGARVETWIYDKFCLKIEWIYKHLHLIYVGKYNECMIFVLVAKIYFTIWLQHCLTFFICFICFGVIDLFHDAIWKIMRIINKTKLTIISISRHMHLCVSCNVLFYFQKYKIFIIYI